MNMRKNGGNLATEAFYVVQMRLNMSLLDERRCHHLSSVRLIGRVYRCGNNWKGEAALASASERERYGSLSLPFVFLTYLFVVIVGTEF